MLTINSNSASLGVQSLLNNITRDLDVTANRISTGKRINTAADDPAGMAIATRMRSDLGSYGAVKNNISSGISLTEVASSALNDSTEIIGEMKKLAIQSQNGTLSTEQRASLQTAFTELQGQFQQTIDGAELFGQNLLKADATDVNILVGIDGTNVFNVKAADTSLSNLSISSEDINITDIEGSAAAITALDEALVEIGNSQAVMGAQQNALHARMRSVDSLTTNIESARSRIEDADMARETSKLTELQTKQQMALAMLGLVNSFPQQALSLL